MKTQLLLSVILGALAMSSDTLLGQQPTGAPAGGVVERVELSGVPDSRLSAGLREDLQKLVGQTYRAAAVDPLVDRIQTELPEYVAAPKTERGSQADRVRLTFKVVKIAEDDALGENINARYTVESVEIEGVARSALSDALLAEMEQMKGQTLDNAKANQFSSKITGELDKGIVAGAMGHYIERKVQRGTSPQQVRVVYEVRKTTHNIHFSGEIPSYHSSLRFTGGRLFLGYRNRYAGSITIGLVNDQLGHGGRIVGAKHSSALSHDSGIIYQYAPEPRIPYFTPSLEYSSVRTQWRRQTQNASFASPTSPPLYRLRDTLLPKLDWQIPKQTGLFSFIDFSTALQLTNLEVDLPGMKFQRANAAVGAVSFAASHTSDKNGVEDSGHANYSVHAGARALGSDYVYARHAFEISYSRTKGANSFTATFLGGRIKGAAPISERFALGDARTLLGWNKFDIAPLGGSRVAQSTLEYHFGMFDVIHFGGAVWDAGQSAEFRQSIAVGINGRSFVSHSLFGTARCWRTLGVLYNPACMNIKVAFPLRQSGFKPTLIVGLKF